MPHHKIYLPEPGYDTPPQEGEPPRLWAPKGIMFQWGPYGENDGSPAVGIGTGNFVETPEDTDRVADGGALEDMMMLWFNRSQLNDIIRTARRARNAAYGTDE